MKFRFEAQELSDSQSSGDGRLSGKEVTSDVRPKAESGAGEFRAIHRLRPAIRPQSRLVAYTEEYSFGAEEFRLLSSRLKRLREQRPIKTLLVTSCAPGDGKTVSATNLAITLARSTSQKVLLLEGDLHHPGLCAMLGQYRRKGLAEYLQSRDPVKNFIYFVEGLDIWFLPGGIAKEPPLNLLQSDRLPELLNLCTSWFDWIVIDSPPLLPLADTSQLARVADGILLVVREGKTPKSLLKKAVETLDKPPLIGVVFNDTEGEQHQYYGKYYARLASKKPGHREKERA